MINEQNLQGLKTNFVITREAKYKSIIVVIDVEFASEIKNLNLVFPHNNVC